MRPCPRCGAALENRATECSACGHSLLGPRDPAGLSEPTVTRDEKPPRRRRASHGASHGAPLEFLFFVLPCGFAGFLIGGLEGLGVGILIGAGLSLLLES